MVCLVTKWCRSTKIVQTKLIKVLQKTLTGITQGKYFGGDNSTSRFRSVKNIHEILGALK